MNHCVKLAAPALLCMYAAAVCAQDDNGWSKPGMTDSRPHLGYSASRTTPTFDMTCDSVGHLTFYARGFVPAQSWPQPPLTVAFGDVERTKRPDLRLVEPQDNWPEFTVLETKFGITDSVLKAIADGASIKLRFHAQEKQIPAPPVSLQKEFAAKCAALLPPGLRKG